MPLPSLPSDCLWYVSYGSNLLSSRLLCYLQGGRPEGAQRTYPGSLDPSPPQDSRPLTLPGRVYFALESLTWSGGMAFLDLTPPALSSTFRARAWLLSLQQFSDLSAQEMRRTPGPLLDLQDLSPTSPLSLGPGHYGTLHHLGELDSLPLLTFTSPLLLPHSTPSPSYRAVIRSGLEESHSLSPTDAEAYLSSLIPAQHLP